MHAHLRDATIGYYPDKHRDSIHTWFLRDETVSAWPFPSLPAPSLAQVGSGTEQLQNDIGECCCPGKCEFSHERWKPSFGARTHLKHVPVLPTHFLHPATSVSAGCGLASWWDRRRCTQICKVIRNACVLNPANSKGMAAEARPVAPPVKALQHP
jgi:hypothetical protein